MQREIEGLLRALQGEGAKRARISTLMQEIIYALHVHGQRMSEADHDLLGRLQRAISDAAPVAPAQHHQQQHDPYATTLHYDDARMFRQ